MPFHIRDQETDQLVRTLAARTGTGLTDAVRMAVAHEIERLDTATPLAERIAPLIARFRKRAIAPLQSDKAFFDELSGDA